MKVRIGLKSMIELLPGKYRYTISANKGILPLNTVIAVKLVYLHKMFKWIQQKLQNCFDNFHGACYRKR